jgi:hypothetical protein
MVAILGNAMPTSDRVGSVDCRCPGFSLNFVAIADDMNVFNGLKNVISRGCVPYMLLDGSDSMNAPYLRAISIAYRVTV